MSGDYRWWTVRAWNDVASVGVKLGPLTVALCHWSGHEYLCLNLLNRWCVYDGRVPADSQGAVAVMAHPFDPANPSHCALCAEHAAIIQRRRAKAEASASVIVGDTMRFSVELIKQIAEMQNLTSELLTLVDVKVQADGSKLLMLNRAEPYHWEPKEIT